MDIDLDELKRLVGLPGDIGYNKMAFWMADHAQEIITEIERLQSERDGLEGVNKILQVKHERLQARLEIDPRHNYDSIDSRDVTIRLQDELIDAIETENGRMQKICAAAYQMAGVVNAPVRFLDVLSRPYEATQEQIDALLPVREDEFVAKLRQQRAEKG